MVHGLRCAPPDPQIQALRDFDNKVRSSFTALTALHLDQSQWDQAARGLSHSGLGLRSVRATLLLSGAARTCAPSWTGPTAQLPPMLPSL